jgi:hypothetical protein
MLTQSNNIFEVLDFVLNKTNTDIGNFKNYYIINRWLSMSDFNAAKIVNATGNRWLLKNSSINILKFYRSILPKTNKKIKYIKKTSKVKNKEGEEEYDFSTLSKNLELSLREIEMYENTIEFLDKNNN